MPELQNCRNIAYYLARCGKRITGNPTITKYLYPSVWHRIMYLLQWRLVIIVMVTTVTSWVEFGVWTSILQIQQLHSFHNLKGQVSKFQTERQCLNAHL